MTFILFADERVPKLSFLLTIKIVVGSNETPSLTHSELEIRTLIIMAHFMVKSQVLTGWIRFLLHPLCSLTSRGQAPCSPVCSQLLRDFRMLRDAWTLKMWFGDQGARGPNQRDLYTLSNLLQALLRLLRLRVLSWRNLGLVFLINLQISGLSLWPSRIPEGKAHSVTSARWVRNWRSPWTQSYLKGESVTWMDYWASNGLVDGQASSGACFSQCYLS